MILYGRLIGAYPNQEVLAEVAFTTLTIVLHHSDFYFKSIFIPRYLCSYTSPSFSIVSNIFTLIKETMFNTFEDISCACQRDFFSSVVICCLWRLLSLGGETSSLR